VVWIRCWLAIHLRVCSAEDDVCLLCFAFSFFSLSRHKQELAFFPKFHPFLSLMLPGFEIFKEKVLKKVILFELR